MTSAALPLSLFISYSHKDDELRARLDTHLSLLKRQNVFDIWHDRRIGAGREWAGEIDGALERADVVLLLVSSDFLASDYCYDKEMTRALQRHEQRLARVVPVILRPCDWQSSPFGKLQALPRDGQPVTSHADIDAALTQVAKALRKLGDEIRGTGTPGPTAPPGASTPTPAAPDSLLPTSRTPRADETPDARPGDAATTAPDAAKRRTLKLPAIKLWGIEIGPIELPWPPRMGAAPAIALMVGGLAATALAAYEIAVKPRLDEARDDMRRGEYALAAAALEKAPSWVPGVAGDAEQARFGARLEREEIRSLAPELAALVKRYPAAPDVLVFEGLESLYVEKNQQQALDRFTRAADADHAHVDAHFLAAGRHVDLAYAALGQGAEAQARAHVAAARSLIDRALSQSPGAKVLPRYANQSAELHEIEGDAPAAFGEYSRLASSHTLSALQAALVSWRLTEGEAALERALEDAARAVKRLDNESADTVKLEGWMFRTGIGETDLIDVHEKDDKLCLMAWSVEISKSLQSASSDESSTVAVLSTSAPKGCAAGAAAAPLREIVCVEVLAAQQAIAPEDGRQRELDRWKRQRLKCNPALRPLPVLPAAGPAVKRVAWVAGGRRP